MCFFFHKLKIIIIKVLALVLLMIILLSFIYDNESNIGRHRSS